MATPTPQPNPNEFNPEFNPGFNPTLTGAAARAAKYADAIALINLIFEPTDLVFTVAAFDGSTNWVGEAHPASVVATPEFMAALGRQNDAGKSVYFCVNPLKSINPPGENSSARCLENIATIRTIMSDFDHDAARLFQELQLLTPPGWVQETSVGKLQKLWPVKDVDKAKFNQAVESIITLGGDDKVKDPTRLMRLPGFVNRKKAYSENPPTVTATIKSNHVSTFEEFRPLLEKYPPVKAVKNQERAANTATTEIGFLKMAAGVGPAESRIGPIEVGKNQPCPGCGSSEKNPNPFGFFEGDNGIVAYRCHSTRAEEGCPGKGDIIDFIAYHDGVDKGTAIRKAKEETFGGDLEFTLAFQEHLSKLAQDARAVKEAQAKAEFDAFVPSETGSASTASTASATAAPVSSPAESAVGTTEAHKAKEKLRTAAEKQQEGWIQDAPIFPMAVLDGDLIGELARLLIVGTFIPPQFVRQNIKVALGHILDGMLGFPGQPNLHMRRFNFNVGPPNVGKGESWNRTNKRDVGYLNGLLVLYGINRVNGSKFGSGQFMSKYLSKNPNTICYFDEGRTLFEQGQVLGSTLESVFLNLFEDNEVDQGSFKNGETSAQNVHLSLSGGFTEDSFTAAFTSRGSQGSGFLSRVELAAGNPLDIPADDWPEIDFEACVAVVEKIKAKIDALGPKVGGFKPYIPEQTPEAKAARIEFEIWLKTQRRNLQARLMSHFKRDLALRAFFSDDGIITNELTELSILWAKDQLALRARLWPEDKGGPIEILEHRILNRLAEGPASDRDLMRACNLNRKGSGGREMYNRAMLALVRSHDMKKLQETTRKGKPLYGLDADDDE